MLLKNTKLRHFSSQTLDLNSPLECSTFLSQKKISSISNKANIFESSATTVSIKSKSEASRKSKENPSILSLDHKSIGALNFQDIQQNLQILVLNECKLKELPHDFSNFPNLKQLSLDVNYLTKIPSFLLEKLALENFSVKRNLLEIMPEKYYKWSESLFSLDVSYNQIDRLDNNLSEMKNLRRLIINNNNFIKIPTSIYSIVFLDELALDWFKYTFPPLPSKISGENLRNFLRFCEYLSSKSKHVFTFLDLIETFSTKPIDFMKSFSKKRNMIHRAAFDNDIGVLRSLITLLPNQLNEIDSENYSALFLSILEENYNSTKILLYSGADPSIGVGMLGSCVHLAVVKKEVFLLQDLLRKGGDPNSTDQQGNTPLHLLFSTFSNNVQKAEKMAKILMEFNSNTHIKNKEMWNCLHLAVKLEQVEALKWVINYNNNERKDFDLDEVGGEVNMTLMHLAGYQGSREMVKLLLDYGCDYFLSDSLNRLPKNLCVSDQLLLKMIKCKEKKDILKNVIRKTSSSNNNQKKKLTINIDESDGNDEFHNKINLPSAKSLSNTFFFSCKSKYFANQNKAHAQVFEENDKNDENLAVDVDESTDNKRHKTIRVILKSPNNIEKIEQYQNARMSYFRKSCGNSINLFKSNNSKPERNLSLKSFSFQNLESMITILIQTNERLKTELNKCIEFKKEDDIFFSLNILMNLQQKEVSLLKGLSSEVNLLDTLFKEDKKKWGENSKEFEIIKNSLNKKGLVHVDCNTFLLNNLWVNLMKNENSENLRICLMILKNVANFIGISGLKYSLRQFLQKNDHSQMNFNKLVVYELFNLIIF